MAEKKKIPEIRFKGFSDEWEERKLNEVADFLKGHGYSKNDLVEVGTPIILYGRLYTKYETIISEVDTFALDSKGSIYSTGNEVILPASGETAEDIARASAVIKSGILLGGDLNIIYPNSKVNSIFLALAISNGKPQKDLSKRAQGKSVVHLRNADLKEVAILFPCNDEQSKLGTFFIHLDHLITLHQRKYNKLVTVKKAMLEKMFPQNGADVPEIRFKGFTESWEEKELSQVVDIRSGCDYKHLSKGDIPVYGTGGYMLSVNKALSYNEDAIGIGRKGTIDKPYILKAPFWTVDTLFYAVPRDENNLQFIYSVFQKINWKQKDESTGVPSLSKVAINGIQVFITDNIEQKVIGGYFKQLDNLITLQQRELEKLKNIKKGCLERMFV